MTSARPPLLLIHGGIAEPMTAHRFWGEPGIIAGLEAQGFVVSAPDRDTTPRSWSAGAQAMADAMADTVADTLTGPAVVLGGSNGVSIALRLALDHPELVRGLGLLWPATADSPQVDARIPASAHHLLDGGTVRGVSDRELGSISVSTAVMAADPESPVHQHHTVDRLVELIPGATRVADAYPEAPRPEFAARRDDFLSTLVAAVIHP